MKRCVAIRPIISIHLKGGMNAKWSKSFLKWNNTQLRKCPWTHKPKWTEIVNFSSSLSFSSQYFAFSITIPTSNNICLVKLYTDMVLTLQNMSRLMFWLRPHAMICKGIFLKQPIIIWILISSQCHKAKRKETYYESFDTDSTILFQNLLQTGQQSCTPHMLKWALIWVSENLHWPCSESYIIKQTRDHSANEPSHKSKYFRWVHSQYEVHSM